MAKRKLPKWIPGTMREFRQRKRKELRELLRAADRVLLGCAYAPTGDDVGYGYIYCQLKKLKIAWSQKEWGK